MRNASGVATASAARSRYPLRETLRGHGDKLFAAACKIGLEGIERQLPEAPSFVSMSVRDIDIFEVEKILLASNFVRRDAHLPSPSTMNASESVDLALIVSASFWVGELYQACAFSMLSNSIRASRSGATPSSRVMLPVRII
jgi:hypothetical protein